MTTDQAKGRHDDPCGAKRRQGEGTCTQKAGWGTDHVGVGRCKLHGGTTPSHRESAREEIATREALALGEPVPIDGVTALQDALSRRYGMVLYWSARCAVVGEENLTQLDVQHRFEKASVELEQLNLAVAGYADVASKCVSLGIQAAAVSVAQEHGQQLITYTRKLLEALGHDPDSPMVVEHVQASLQLVGGGL